MYNHMSAVLKLNIDQPELERLQRIDVTYQLSSLDTIVLLALEHF